LSCPVFALAPFAIYKQHKEAGEDAAAALQAKASAVGCLVATLLVGCVAGSVGMLCWRLDGGSATGFGFGQAIIPVLVVEGLLALSLLSLPRGEAVQQALWKALRVGFLLLLANKLDGADWCYPTLPCKPPVLSEALNGLKASGAQPVLCSQGQHRRRGCVRHCTVTALESRLIATDGVQGLAGGALAALHLVCSRGGAVGERPS